MGTVNTVLGPVDASKLGVTLSHEHIATGSAGMHTTYPQFFDRETVVRDAVSALKEAHAEGVRSYIEPTTFDLGRDIELMQEVSRLSGVHIVLPPVVTKPSPGYSGRCRPMPLPPCS